MWSRLNGLTLRGRVAVAGIAALVAAAFSAQIRWFLRRLNANRAPALQVSQEAPAPAPAPAAEAPAQEGGASSSAAAHPFANGTEIELSGLTSKPEFNGQLGKVVRFDERRGRYNIRLNDGRSLHARPANVLARPGGPTAAPASAPSVPAPSASSAADLFALSLRDPSALTAAHAERALSLLQSSPANPFDIGVLLRCLVCARWHVPCVRRGKASAKSGAERVCCFPLGDQV